LRCDYNPSQIQRRCPELNTEGLFHRNLASLAYSTRSRCSRHCTSSCFYPWARPGPMACSHIAGEPRGSHVNMRIRICLRCPTAWCWLHLPRHAPITTDRECAGGAGHGRRTPTLTAATWWGQADLVRVPPHGRANDRICVGIASICRTMLSLPTPTDGACVGA
jgi:hypothetical protein